MRLSSIIVSVVAAILVTESSFGSIYFDTSSTGRVRRVETDGTGLQTLVDTPTTGIENARGMAVDPIGGRVYFSGEGRSLPSTHRIASVLLNGSGFVPVMEGLPASDIEVDPIGGKLYFARGSRELYRMNFDGSEFETINFSFLSGGVDISALALDISAGKVYFTETGADRIYRSNLDGTSTELVVQINASNSFVPDLEIDPIAGVLYWVDDGQNKMQRATISSGLVEDVLVGVPGYGAYNRRLLLDVSSHTVYWSTPGSPFGPGNPGGIFKAGFDGSGVSQVLVNEEDIHGLDFGPFVPLAQTNVIPEPSSIGVWTVLAIVAAASFRRSKRLPSRGH